MKKLACITLVLAGSFIATAATDSRSSYVTVEKYETHTFSGRVTPFCMAVVKGDIETVRKLIDLGENVNKYSGSGLTALMYAARYNRVEIIELLIEKGADITAKNTRTGFTALKYAELSNAEEAYRILERALSV